MIRILVIGKNGQLGKSLHKLIEKRRDYDIFTFVGRQTLDLSDDANIKYYFEKNLFNIIINCAAYTQVDKAEEASRTLIKVESDLGHLREILSRIEDLVTK